MAKNNKKWLGFSLIELMAVVAIIGVLVSLAIPRFRVFVARARMSEAIHNLGVIDRLQKSYNLHFQMLGDDEVWWNTGLIGRNDGTSECDDSTDGTGLKNKLGFRVENCAKLRYFYTGGTDTDSARNGSGGGAINYRIYPGCADGDDEWKIHRAPASSKIDHTDDIIVHCK